MMNFEFTSTYCFDASTHSVAFSFEEAVLSVNGPQGAQIPISEAGLGLRVVRDGEAAIFEVGSLESAENFRRTINMLSPGSALEINLQSTNGRPFDTIGTDDLRDIKAIHIHTYHLDIQPISLQVRPGEGELVIAAPGEDPGFPTETAAYIGVISKG